MPPVPPTPLPPRTPLFPPEPPKRRFNRFAIYLALGVALVFIPLTLQFQKHRVEEYHPKREMAPPSPTPTVEETGDESRPAELRQWHMQGVDGITEGQARQRFGKPIFSRDYNLTYGAFLGPKFGLKHYYLENAPGFEQREKEAQVEWKFPRYSTVREMIWKMHESYITLWLGEPLREVNIKGDSADAIFPATGPGEWVVLDNYRVGQDLVKAPPVTVSPTAAP